MLNKLLTTILALAVLANAGLALSLTHLDARITLTLGNPHESFEVASVPELNADMLVGKAIRKGR